MVLQKLSRLVKPRLYRMTFTIAPNTIRVFITQGDNAIPSAEFLALPSIPPLVRDYLQKQTPFDIGLYEIPFNAARRIIREFKNAPSEQISIDSSALDTLQPVTLPEYFGIEWEFNRSSQSLRRILHNATGYLGSGCFFQDNLVWKIENLDNAILRWLVMPEIPASEWILFLKQGLPGLPANLYQSDIILDESGQNIIIEGEMFPVVDATQLPLRWHLQKKMHDGIGSYTAVPVLATADEQITIASIDHTLGTQENFYFGKTAWIELTPAFQQRLADWKAKGLGEVTLFPQEIIGANRTRLNKMKLSSPALNVNLNGTQEQQVRQFLENMRYHGLPAGIAGLQSEIPEVITAACTDLLRDDTKAKILWIVSPRRKSAILEALQQAKLPTTDLQNIQAGQIALTTLDKPFPMTLAWSLIIFTDLDLLPSQEKHIRAYASLQRKWTICTFARSNWDQDKEQAGRLITALGLRPNDLAAFEKNCIHTFSHPVPRQTSPLPSLFKEMIIGEDNPDNISLPIPTPPTTLPTEKIEPFTSATDTVHDSVFRPSFDGRSEDEIVDRFLKQAQHFVDRVGQKTEEVEFINYYKTYDGMNDTQKNWYFYWRSQVRQGNYLSTDLSYIFVHVYEVLHLVGFRDALTAFDHLKNIWEHYSVFYPQLDSYLIDWLADFTQVYNLSITPLHWYAYALQQGGEIHQKSLALEAWLAVNGDWEQIPNALLNDLCLHDRTKSKFYQQYRSDSSIEIEVAFRRGLAAIDHYLQERGGKSLFARSRPLKQEMIRRIPFADAVYEGSREEIVIETVPVWSEAESLKDAVTAIVRYTENRLRDQRNFKGKQAFIELPPDWAAVLDALFPTTGTTPKPRIAKEEKQSRPTTIIPKATIPDAVTQDFEFTYDAEEIAALRQSSASVRDRLTVDDETPPDELNTFAPSLTHPVADEGVNEITIEFVTERPADAPSHLLTDLPEVATVLAGDQNTIHLLQFLQTQGWECDQSLAQRAIEYEFLNVVLDRLNERALDIIGDNLIYIEGEVLIVLENYRDELEFLFANALVPDQPMMESFIVLDNDIVAPSMYADLSPEWAEFVAKMQSYHWEALGVILTGNDIVLRLHEIARRVYTPASVLIDEINEFALTAIGDIVIDISGIPFVEAEDWEVLDTLMIWTRKHILKD